MALRATKWDENQADHKERWSAPRSVFDGAPQARPSLGLRITCNYNTRMATPAVPTQLTMRQALAIPAFRKLWLATLVSVFGDFLALYAVFSEMTFRMHASARAITLVTVFFLLPLAFVGPVAGVFVDRWEPRRTMVTSDIARAILVLGLVLARAPWHIYGVFLALSTFSSFFSPARSVTIPQILPLHGLMSANAVIQQTVQILQMGSPVLAGALAGFAGPGFLLLPGQRQLRVLGPDDRHHRHPGARGACQPEHEAGAAATCFPATRFIVGHPVIGFVILSIAAGTFAISAFGSLIAVFVRDVLHANSVLFGALGSAIGFGMLAGGLAVAPLARRMRQKAHLITVGILLCGVSIASIARVANPVVALAGLRGHWRGRLTADHRREHPDARAGPGGDAREGQQQRHVADLDIAGGGVVVCGRFGVAFRHRGGVLRQRGAAADYCQWPARSGSGNRWRR